MYSRVLNSREKARCLIDIVRDKTGAPLSTCIDTVSHILGSLIADMPFELGLRDLRNALTKEDIIDLDNCFDAKELKHLMAKLTDFIEDKKQVCVLM